MYIVDTMEMITATDQEILEIYNVREALHIIRKGSTLPFEEAKHVDLAAVTTCTCNND